MKIKVKKGFAEFMFKYAFSFLSPIASMWCIWYMVLDYFNLIELN